MEDINWANLTFGYMKTDYNVRSYYRNGQWSDFEITDSEQITMHMAATCLHYGQEAFEGLKAFKGKDGRIRIFRMRENA
ncbi:MAG: branched chain amino acid aminotransferase, partial [Dysgonamonadaceae bacterium]|nr:branched chain amino acid aminotransferase [Dysgonamonadaceae bacterium]